VLAEFVALSIARRAPQLEALRFIDAIRKSHEIEIVWVDRDLHDQAMRLLTQRQDKSWSLCDAVSFIPMSQRAVFDALTTDQDFDQAGFARPLDR
jgi:predicted nucleic acid-binding protein